MKLEALLPQLTPLPLVMANESNDPEGRFGFRLESPQSGFMVCEIIWTGYAMAERPHAYVAYLTHAANHLPACVTALRALTDWGRTHTSPLDANSPHALLIQATEALAAAENVPV
jgi:hypothetical protein